MSETESIPSAARLSDLPRLPRDEGGPVFAEPWQAQAFALAVKLSEQGHFTWKEWAASLAEELQAAAKRGEQDDGSRYYEHWLAALERLVTAKGLTDQNALLTRREAWAEAYRATPHGTPVELASRKPDARWVLLGVASTFAGYWLIRQSNIAAPGEVRGRSELAELQRFRRWDLSRAPLWARYSACSTRSSRTISRRWRRS